MKIDLHIEELVLHGFRRADRRRIAAAVQRELTRLISEQGVPRGWQTGGEVARLDVGTFEAPAQMKARGVGQEVARVIYAGMSRGLQCVGPPQYGHPGARFTSDGARAFPSHDPTFTQR